MASVRPISTRRSPDFSSTMHIGSDALIKSSDTKPVAEMDKSTMENVPAAPPMAAAAAAASFDAEAVMDPGVAPDDSMSALATDEAEQPTAGKKQTATREQARDRMRSLALRAVRASRIQRHGLGCSVRNGEAAGKWNDSGHGQTLCRFGVFCACVLGSEENEGYRCNSGHGRSRYEPPPPFLHVLQRHGSMHMLLVTHIVHTFLWPSPTVPAGAHVGVWLALSHP
jgi:hypothetical protein